LDEENGMEGSKIKTARHSIRFSNFQLIGLPTLLVPMFLLIGCNDSSKLQKKTKKDTFSSSGNPQLSDAEKRRDVLAKNQRSDPETFFEDYPVRYCTHVWKLKLRADVSEYLKYFCDGSTPTKNLMEWRERVIREPGKLEIKQIFYEGNKEKETSEMKFVWGYYLESLRPFRVKEKPLYSYVTKPFKDDFIDLKSTAERQSDEVLDHGLHLWNTKVSYNLQLTTAPGMILPSLRDTQYNLYQVESGNEEMGFGVETLTDGHNGDYSASVMLNLSFNDGLGFNDGKGGTVVVNILHLKMANKGFVETTEKTLNKLGNFLATSMYESLSEKKP
jgi:hypothetical protein